MRETHTPDKYIKDIVKQDVESSTFVNFSISGNNSLPLVVCGLFERLLASMRAVWWKMLSAVWQRRSSPAVGSGHLAYVVDDSRERP